MEGGKWKFGLSWGIPRESGVMPVNAGQLSCGRSGSGAVRHRAVRQAIILPRFHDNRNTPFCFFHLSSHLQRQPVGSAAYEKVKGLVFVYLLAEPPDISPLDAMCHLRCSDTERRNDHKVELGKQIPEFLSFRPTGEISRRANVRDFSLRSK